MSSTVSRIKLEGSLRVKQLADREKLKVSEDESRLIRLRSFMHNEMINMSVRCANSSAAPVVAFRWLRGKTFDQTFRDDYGPESKKDRTKQHVDAFLMLCDYDEELFLSEYARSLELDFPIPFKSYEWAPRLVRSDSRHVTVLHEWRRKRRIRAKSNSVVLDG